MATTGERVWKNRQSAGSREPLGGAYFWLVVFLLLYCARPEDWVPGLYLIPIVKISGIFALLALLLSLGKSKRALRDLPREALYLLGLMVLLMVSAVTSPVWRGGAFFAGIDFAKAFLAILVILLAVTSLRRLRRLIFVQTASVVLVACLSLLKAHSGGRLSSSLNVVYGNPNDLAFAIVLTLPFCLLFLLNARGLIRKGVWTAAVSVMALALFLTASRAGFIALLISGSVLLWHFAIQGRRPYLIVAAVTMVTALFGFAGGTLKERFAAISGQDLNTSIQMSAYGSFEQRSNLIVQSLHGIAEHPLLGLGIHNFKSWSGTWSDVHNAYLQMAVEGGIPALILFLLIFWQGLANLRRLRRMPDPGRETVLYAGALHSVLIGFIVGAMFAPEAYHYFPYFAVSYTWVLLAVTREQAALQSEVAAEPRRLQRRADLYEKRRKSQGALVAR